MRKMVSIVSWTAAKWIDSFPCLMLLSWPLANGVEARKLDIRFLRIQYIYSANLSQIPCGLTSLMLYHFFSESGPINDHCPVPNFLADKDTTLACARHSSLFSIVPQEISLNIVLNGILPVNFLVFLVICSVDMWLYHRAATLWILGRCSTRIQSALHWFLHSLCSFCRSWPLQSFSSKLRWIPDVDGSFQGTTQNRRRHRLLCAEDC